MEQTNEKKDGRGRPSLLTKELSLKIRKAILQGKKAIEIQGELEINPSTWDSWFYEEKKVEDWDEARNFRQLVIDWRRERMLAQAEDRIPDFLASQDERVGADMTKHVTETLGRIAYSKRTDIDLSGSVTVEVRKIAPGEVEPKPSE